MAPEVGDFYYHYKHNPNLNESNYLYKIIGIALHTETEEEMVIYEPQYESDHKLFARPLLSWLEDVQKESYTGPRFYKK